jgi:hypothetical protein
MTKKQTTEQAANAGTIETEPQPDRLVSAHRAQAEMIEMLAGLVLAAAEREQQRDAAIDSPTRGPARQASKEARRTRAAGAWRDGSDRSLGTGVHRRRAEGPG